MCSPNLRLHPLRASCSAPLPVRFTNPFCYEPHPLCLWAADEVRHFLALHDEWAHELARGKMFGVLVAVPADVPAGAERNALCFLAAFSGLLDGRNDIPFFVPPIYDLLAPGGHFQQEQTVISGLNERIRALEGEGCADSVSERCTRGQRKAVAALRQERRSRSAALQDWLFNQFVCRNARGEQKCVTQIFKDFYRETMLRAENYERNAQTHHIPSGTGECCAPKLLQYAYAHRLRPLCMAEFWVGASPREEVRHDGQFYPACNKKCRPLLRFMLQGLDVEVSFLERRDAELLSRVAVVYEDADVMAVDKPCGLLSVPSRDTQVSVVDWLWQRGADASPVHRLDQDTSGLLLIAKSKEALRCLHRQFVEHAVRKRYVAVLDGEVARASGTVALPLRKDPNDAPRQVVDFARGKQSVTRYEVVGPEPVADAAAAPRTRVFFYPETGRTHQLRVHAAHAEGIGCPIVGDRLYGLRPPASVQPSTYRSLLAPRLMLHAASIDFVHPSTGRPVHIECPVPF